MSAPKLISPLLDNFIMGEPIFDRDGVRILPAMEQEKEEKYIVKIISIPANQSQVDALLITGAYKDADAVNGYFNELAQSLIQECTVLTQLSNAGGFDGYTDMQVIPMDDGNGYDVYLLAPYRPTWDRVAQQKTVTQLDGYNLALDLCAALSVARRNGYLYANLKPESISVAPSGSYHICDLGLLSLDYLQYSSLPSSYFNPYTAPELTDAFSSLNSTMDVYSLGMLLYEVFNGGLPFEGERAAAAEYPAPLYAEEEFAEIILKAIHPDTAMRWQDPTEMGQAIVNVMQRKGVSDAPIIPVVEVQEEPVEEVPAATDENEEGPVEEITEEIPTTDTLVETVTEIVPSEPVSNEESEEITPAKEVPEEIELSQEADVPADDVSAEETTSEQVDNVDNVLQEADHVIAELDGEPEQIPAEETYEQLEIEEPVTESVITEEAEEDCAPVPADEEEAPAPKKSRKRKVAIICSAVLIALLLIGGLFFYRHIYLQEIDVLSVTGAADTIEILVDTDVDSDKLTVVCTSEDGNTAQYSLVDYKATVSGLNASTTYTVTLKIDGFHKLIGQTEYVYTTPEKTIISDFTVLNGIEEGTAEVSYKITGPDKGTWTVTFSAQDEGPHTVTVADGRATVSGLTPGKEYTVTLASSDALYIDEEVELTFTPGPALKPVNPYVQSLVDGKLTVQCSTGDGTDISWVVRCYNNDGFDETVTVTGLTAVFNVTEGKAYTIEVSVKGQAAKETLYVSEKPITLSDFTVDTSLPGIITLQWKSNAEIPENGYTVTYTVDGVKAEAALKTSSNSLMMKNAVPDAVHVFTITTENGQSVLCGPVSAKATGKNTFEGFGVKTSSLRFNLCPRPKKTPWSYSDVKASSYTTTFAVSQKAALVCRIITMYYTSTQPITTLYVFRDADNAITHFCSVERSWGSYWYNGFGTFDIPSLPAYSGEYTMDMYFDGCLVYHSPITIK